MTDSNIEKVIHQLMNLNYTISFMESCSGGSLVNAFTNVKGSSHVLGLSAVTYGDEAKIKLGVNPKTIEKYSAYSTQVSKEMAKSISKFANSNIGVGICGNLHLTSYERSSNREVYISIYNKETKRYSSKVILIEGKDKIKAKQAIINFIINDLITLLAIN